MSRPGEQLGSRVDVFSNLLNNEDFPRYPQQRDRLPGIAQSVQAINNGSGPDVLFMCEGASAQSIIDLSELVGMQVIGEPYQYSADEVMAFAVRPELAAEAALEYVPVHKKARNHGFLLLVVDGIASVGLHQRHRMIRDERARRETVETAIEVTAGYNAAVIGGDFNARPHYTTRQKLVRAGFIDTLAANHPPYPSPGFESAGGLRFVPDFIRNRVHLSFDGVYVKGIPQSVANWATSTGSDHPITFVTHNGALSNDRAIEHLSRSL